MPIPSTFRPITRPTMRDEVYDTLLGWIMEAELRPGERLSDNRLADTLGVSRTPVREALRRLEDKGLVEASANRWTRVAPVTVAEAEQIYPIIWKLEELAVETAADNLTVGDFRALRRANQDLRRAVRAGEARSASRADERFHDVFIQRSANSCLIAMLQDLKVRHRRLEVLFFEAAAGAENSAEDHDRIISALQARDVPDACRLIRSNWQVSLDQLRSGAPRRSGAEPAPRRGRAATIGPDDEKDPFDRM